MGCGVILTDTPMHGGIYTGAPIYIAGYIQAATEIYTAMQRGRQLQGGI